MKKVILLTSAIVSILIFTSGDCSTSNNPSDPPLDPVDPITNTWTVYNSGGNHEYFFQTFDSSAARGVFFGNEQGHPQRFDNDLCGFFDNRYLEFDVRVNNVRIKFKGNFITSDSMVIRSDEDGELILTR